MGFNEVVKQLEGLVVITSVVGIIFALLKTGTTKATIQSQKELIETLTTQVNELRNLHIENEKAISELQGQVSVYKELPPKPAIHIHGGDCKSSKRHITFAKTKIVL